MAGDPALRAAAERTLVQLLNGKPTQQAAQRYLYRESLEYFAGRSMGRPDHEDLVRIWRWDPASQQVVSARLPAKDASVQRAGSLADELARLAPENTDYRKLQAAAQLQAAKAADPRQPLPRGEGTPFQLAARLGAPALEDVLRLAMDRGHAAAAVAALEILGEIGGVDLLMRPDGQPGVVCQALRSPDRRVRFAALQAVLRMDPRERFPGASFVSESLAFFTNHSGSRRVLVAHPRIELAQTLAGTLLDAGYEADTVVLGNQAIQAAARNSDYEFLLISDAIDRPPVHELLQQLRREPRTTHLPLAVLAREGNLERMEELTAGDSLALSFPAPYEPSAMAFLVGRLRERAGAGFADVDERLEQAMTALEAMAVLAERPEIYGFYDLLAQQNAVDRAAASPPLTHRALRVLGLFATPSAQRTLVAVASQNGRPLADRQAAAAAFEVAVQRRGLLLTHDEILSQYDRYNASATLDRGTQQVLGAILDSIELPAAHQAR
jgi:hypothetical protein